MGVLQGTFDTLPLTEVLKLLAQSEKTGALWLRAGSVEGRIYLADGRCCAAESVEQTEPVTTDRDLGQRLVDVCFTLARHPGGSFRFVLDDEPTWRVGGAGVEIDDAVGALDRLLEEWREIQAVIPSLEVRPRLAPELGSDSIIIDAPRWRLLVSLDGRRSVRDLMHEQRRSVLDICNALKELIEEGAVEVDVADVPAPDAADAAEAANAVDGAPLAADDADAVEERAAALLADDGPAGEMAPEVFAGAEDAAPTEGTDAGEAGDGGEDAEAGESTHVATAEGDTAVDDAAFDDGEVRDRGALLRLFSALRET
jgi:hypothetical protein